VPVANHTQEDLVNQIFRRRLPARHTVKIAGFFDD